MTPEQPTEQDPPAQRRLRVLRPAPAVAAAAVLFLVLGSLGGYVLGRQRPVMQQAQVRCVSAPGGISCTDDADAGGAEFWVPRDVAWTDAGGRIHLGDRPACLPPGARGAQGSVGITWVTVEVSGRSWRQAVGVDC